eukprot:4121747-Lingulodinium_polyedra.AAC.1
MPRRGRTPSNTASPWVDVFESSASTNGKKTMARRRTWALAPVIGAAQRWARNFSNAPGLAY